CPSFHNNKIFVLLFSGGLSTLPPHSREYHIVNEKMSWTEAQSYCRENFTDLATIYNSNINQLLVTMVPNVNEWVWIGLYNDRYNWKWSMEENLFYVDCANAKEFCVGLQGQTQMNDRSCGDSCPFLSPDAFLCKLL
uniref:C-type lectin domain-containing protein n=1 Tax=Pundamilia nyererei TaxID=303518 RepID=A0A3B4GFJ2_9CICH